LHAAARGINPALPSSATLRYFGAVEATFSHYQLVRQLGAGIAADVFLARDENGRDVALKVLHRHLTSNSEQVRRFQQEAEWVSLLHHPNIVSLYEVGQSDGRYYMVTEFVDGETLRDFILSEMPVARVVDISIGVARALAEAHAHWIVHRDVKPENILLGRNGGIKLVDFGFAKLTRPNGQTPHLTRPGMVLGTISYLAPEQILGWGVDPRTDLWALGIVTFETLTGFPPFDAPSNSEVVQRIIRDDPPPIAGARSDVPERLKVIISKLLRKDPDERYQTAAGLLDDLNLVCHDLHGS
jgi:eukaryotic-like serine/threonine-protein kinase